MLSRTMVAEITVEKKYQSRAFLILPMSFNVAGILGPSECHVPLSSHFTNTFSHGRLAG